MSAEVQEWGRADGWHDSPVSFGEALAYLHSEVSEVLEAWRRWGTRDATHDCRPYDDGGSCTQPHEQKPEGVGSEFADVLIRLLDTCIRFGVDPQAEVRLQEPEYALSDSFPENVNTLHFLVARAYMAHQMGDDLGAEFACIYAYVRQLCAEHGVDLLAEYDRKMTWNRANPHRHEKRQR
jgi:NTP pyrophosphatase (non-canonical NTP hydrolase)